MENGLWITSGFPSVGVAVLYFVSITFVAFP